MEPSLSNGCSRRGGYGGTHTRMDGRKESQTIIMDEGDLMVQVASSFCTNQICTVAWHFMHPWSLLRIFNGPQWAKMSQFQSIIIEVNQNVRSLLKMVQGGSQRCPDNHDLSKCHWTSCTNFEWLIYHIPSTYRTFINLLFKNDLPIEIIEYYLIKLYRLSIFLYRPPESESNAPGGTYPEDTFTTLNFGPANQRWGMRQRADGNSQK